MITVNDEIYNKVKYILKPIISAEFMKKTFGFKVRNKTTVLISRFYSSLVNNVDENS